MKVAETVIFLLGGGGGGGDSDSDSLSSVIYGGLRPNPSSDFETRSDSFELTLELYGIRDRKASGKILHHVNASGFLEVSILVLQNYERPILACAMNEVLLNLAGADSSTLPTIIAAFSIPESKLKQGNMYSVASDDSIYGVKLGPTTDVTDAFSSILHNPPPSLQIYNEGLAFSSKLQNPPPSLQIYNEGLALLLHLVNVMKFPAFVLVGQSKQHISNRTSKEELQVICDVGEHLANALSLSFSREAIPQNPTKISRESKEAWHVLYG